MVLPIVNVPPPNSNQTPIGPNNPAKFQGIPQMIKTWIPTDLPPGIQPGSYTQQSIIPGGVQEIGGIIVGRINYPAGYQGIPQYIKTAIPPGRGPDTYARQKMSYAFDFGSALGGAILGFIAGALVFTATGRKVTSTVSSAAAERAAYYLAPRAR